MNVKSKLLGKLKCNENQNSFTGVDDVRLQFLNNFLKWMDKWEGLNTPGLTDETHSAIYWSTSVMIE